MVSFVSICVCRYKAVLQNTFLEFQPIEAEDARRGRVRVYNYITDWYMHTARLGLQTRSRAPGPERRSCLPLWKNALSGGIKTQRGLGVIEVYVRM